MNLPFGQGSFLDFSDGLTGYRLSAILMLMEERNNFV